MFIEGIIFYIGFIISIFRCIFYGLILFIIFMIIQFIFYRIFNINIYKKLMYILFERY